MAPLGVTNPCPGQHHGVLARRKAIVKSAEPCKSFDYVEFDLPAIAMNKRKSVYDDDAVVIDLSEKMMLQSEKKRSRPGLVSSKKGKLRP